MIKFGQSTRWFILNGGPEEDEEEETDEQSLEQPRKKI